MNYEITTRKVEIVPMSCHFLEIGDIATVVSDGEDNWHILIMVASKNVPMLIDITDPTNIKINGHVGNYNKMVIPLGDSEEIVLRGKKHNEKPN